MIVFIAASITKVFGDVPTCSIVYFAQSRRRERTQVLALEYQLRAFLEEPHMDDIGHISTYTERDELGVNNRTLLSPDALPIPTLDNIVHRWWL